MGDDLVDQSPLVGACRVHEVPREAHLPGPVDADELGEPDRESPARHGADPRVGVGEPGPVRGDEEVARKGELESPRDRSAVDRPDDRGLVAGQQPEVQGALGLTLLLERAKLGREASQVEPGTERGICTGQDHGRDGGVLVEPDDRVSEPGHQLGRERVAHFGPVEGDGRDPLADVDLNVHAGAPSGRWMRSPASPIRVEVVLEREFLRADGLSAEPGGVR